MNRWEEEHGRPCPHDYTFDLQLGLNGDLFYHCPMCRRTAKLNVKMLKRHIRYRLNKQQEKERAQQEQGARQGAGEEGSLFGGWSGAAPQRSTS